MKKSLNFVMGLLFVGFGSNANAERIWFDTYPHDLQKVTVCLDVIRNPRSKLLYTLNTEGMVTEFYVLDQTGNSMSLEVYAFSIGKPTITKQELYMSCDKSKRIGKKE